MDNQKTSSRGDQTREALLSAAMEIFGRDGFHAASTRAIAEAAGVNQALIAYHFDGKEGLYLAVFESIAEQVSALLRPRVDALDRAIEDLDPAAPDTRAASVDYLEQLFSALLEMFGSHATPAWVKLIMSEQQEPTAAFDIIWDGIYSDMLNVLTRLVALASGQSADDESARVLALTLFGQILVFLVARATAHRLLGWEELGEKEFEAVRRQVLQNLRAQFSGEVTA